MTFWTLRPSVHWQIEIICFIHFGKIISNRLKLQDIQVKIYFLFFFPELIYFIKMTFENTLGPSQDQNLQILFQNLPNHAVPYKINQSQYLIRLLIISRVNFCLKLMSQIPSNPTTQNLRLEPISKYNLGWNWQNGNKYLEDSTG